MGSVRQRGDKWYFSFELAKVGGKRRRIEKIGGTTKKEAEIALSVAMVEYLNAGSIFNVTESSVSDYLDYWYENYVEVELKYNSQRDYKRIIDKHIKPAIGKYKLRTITPAVLQTFLNNKKIAGFSRGSLSGFRGVLSSAFSKAFYPYQFIKTNPMLHVKTPRVDSVKTPDDLKIITTSDYKKILNRFPRGTRFYLPIVIAYNTGLRVSEVCGLTWDYVDLAAKTIQIKEILISMPHGQYAYGTPKTESSNRIISISSDLVSELKAQKLYQIENRSKYGQFYTDNNSVCTEENGQVVKTDAIKYLSRIVNKKLGITFNFHSFRHTHASMLLAAGANIKAIQARLGHANYLTTMNLYAHITPELKAETDLLIEELSDIGE
jgi:integrase